MGECDRGRRSGALALAFLAAALLLAPAARSAARENGIVTEGCDGCHNGGEPPQVSIQSNLSAIAPLQTVRLTISIQAVNGARGGLYLQATPAVGKLAAVSGQSTKLSGEAGLVHSAPRAATGNSVQFTVDWTAPAQPGGVEFWVYALSANGDGRSQGDGGGTGFLSLAYGCEGKKYFRDQDGDGEGSPDGEYRMACSQPMYFAPNNTDCDDNDERVRLAAPEICNGRDDDCDGAIDELLPIVMYCEDKDGDGHGVTSAKTAQGCRPEKGFGLCDQDCNDADPSVYPNAEELCNSRDDNCNNRADEGARRTCGVGWCRRTGSSCTSDVCTPGEPMKEMCNDFDDDCDGVNDNGENLCGVGKACVQGYCLVSDAGVGRAADAGVVSNPSEERGEDASGAAGGGQSSAPDASGSEAEAAPAESAGCSLGGRAARERVPGSSLLLLALGFWRRRRGGGGQVRGVRQGRFSPASRSVNGAPLSYACPWSIRVMPACDKVVSLWHNGHVRLPKWVVDNQSSLREEAAPYLHLTPQERGSMLAAACRAGAKLLRVRPDAARILERVDPLPDSSERALARLRAAHLRAREDARFDAGGREPTE